MCVVFLVINSYLENSTFNSYSIILFPHKWLINDERTILTLSTASPMFIFCTRDGRFLNTKVTPLFRLCVQCMLLYNISPPSTPSLRILKGSSTHYNESLNVRPRQKILTEREPRPFVVKLYERIATSVLCYIVSY